MYITSFYGEMVLSGRADLFLNDLIYAFTVPEIDMRLLCFAVIFPADKVIADGDYS